MQCVFNVTITIFSVFCLHKINNVTCVYAMSRSALHPWQILLVFPPIMTATLCKHRQNQRHALSYHVQSQARSGKEPYFRALTHSRTNRSTIVLAFASPSHFQQNILVVKTFATNVAFFKRFLLNPFPPSSPQNVYLFERFWKAFPSSEIHWSNVFREDSFL